MIALGVRACCTEDQQSITQVQFCMFCCALCIVIGAAAICITGHGLLICFIFLHIPSLKLPVRVITRVCPFDLKATPSFSSNLPSSLLLGMKLDDGPILFIWGSHFRSLIHLPLDLISTKVLLVPKSLH